MRPIAHFHQSSKEIGPAEVSGGEKTAQYHYRFAGQQLYCGRQNESHGNRPKSVSVGIAITVFEVALKWFCPSLDMAVITLVDVESPQRSLK